MEKHSKLWNTFLEYALITAATLIIVGGTYVFKFPNNFSFGGVTGIAVVLGRVSSISPSTWTFIINMALLVLGFAMLGKDFGVKTVYVSVLMSAGLSLMEKLFPMSGPLTQQPVLELVFAISLPAFASAVLFNIGASSGGTDILAMIFRMVYFDPWMLILTTGLFNIVLVPLTDFPLLLVEEKERDTLSLLFRSGVTLAQFAAAKAVACLVVGELMAVVVFLIAGADMSLLPEYLLVHLAGVTALLPWGFLTGVYAKDQNSVNVYAAISVVAVYVAPVFSYWNVAFGRLAEFLPTGILGVVL